MQKLSKRLQAVADFVSPGSWVADIGTDHGFLPIYLVQSGRCPHALAMDIRMGPLERAREHIRAAGLETAVDTRLSDGMQKLKAGEADSVVITGMGGLTVIGILQAGQGLPAFADFKELVLEPQSDLLKVRRFLREHSMDIDKEELVLEAGKFYPVLHVVLHKPKLQEGWDRDMHKIQEALLGQLADRARVRGLLDRYGECTVYGKHPMLRLLLEREEARELGILCGLTNGVRAACETHGAHEAREGTRGGQGKNADVLLARKYEVEKRLEEVRVLREVLYGKR